MSSRPLTGDHTSRVVRMVSRRRSPRRDAIGGLTALTRESVARKLRALERHPTHDAGQRLEAHKATPRIFP